MKVIYSAWLSPARKEIYEVTKTNLSLDREWEMSDVDADFLRKYAYCSIFDMFEESEQDGLWYIVVEVSFTFTKDYWGGVDLDLDIEDIHCKTKCKDFSELRFFWGCIKRKEELKLIRYF